MTLEQTIDRTIATTSEMIHLCCVGNPDLSRIRYRLGRRAADAATEQLAHFVGERFAPLGGQLVRDRDECFAIVQDCSTESFARALDALKVGPARPLVIDGQSMPMRTVVGWASESPGRSTAAELVDASRLAFEIARADGVPRAICHRANPDTSLMSLSLAADLGRALGTTGLDLHFQPKLSTRDLRLVGVEALLRWRHPSHGHVGPKDILRVAQLCGLMDELNRWIVQRAVAQCAAWRHRGLHVPMAINLSAGALADASLVLIVEQALAEYSVPGDQLIFEVTETDMLDNPAAAQMTACALNELGATLSLDDFGTGCSTLSQLRQIPASEIKIDRSFVASALGDASAAEIVRALVGLARSLGMNVVGEGVEDVATWRWLRDMGCDRVQGYLFAQPMVGSALPNFVATLPSRLMELEPHRALPPSAQPVRPASPQIAPPLELVAAI